MIKHCAFTAGSESFSICQVLGLVSGFIWALRFPSRLINIILVTMKLHHGRKSDDKQNSISNFNAYGT